MYALRRWGAMHGVVKCDDQGWDDGDGLWWWWWWDEEEGKRWEIEKERREKERRERKKMSETPSWNRKETGLDDTNASQQPDIPPTRTSAHRLFEFDHGLARYMVQDRVRTTRVVLLTLVEDGCGDGAKIGGSAGSQRHGPVCVWERVGN
ncbi:hypothetical protein CVT26_004568 [Gymnopilus dilepis]|uniref:Uncharacterized protein n=1 Tax=Gymnopilus dilepis TaxID=231916 RepID=A0A409YJ58_9AGAR|nr:hypothetical protein CVT26_004568 [Gymnopilus dilepis]